MNTAAETSGDPSTTEAVAVAASLGTQPQTGPGAAEAATQWLVCIGMASLVLVLGELRKLVMRAWLRHMQGAAPARRRSAA